MKDYLLYDLSNHTIYVSRINGNQIIVPSNTNLTNHDLRQIILKNHMNDEIPVTNTY
jgi:hypothetical protein